MNKSIFLFFFLLSAFLYLPLNAQINEKHNRLRADDKLVKQQVEFKDPGEAGRNRIWDFSSLKTVNDAYTLDYAPAPLLDDSIYIMGYRNYDKKTIDADDLIVGTEHYTMYYYQVSNDSLLLVGHENPVNKLNYTRPIVLMKYPFNYGQSVTSNYQSEGLYSGKDTIRTHGMVISVVDAFGKMLLPDGDTLQLVLRTKTTQTIIDDLKDNDQGMQMETYRWYLKGYRYPVFEAVRGTNIADNSPIFSTAFYFPPQEHLYLDTDPENLALLEELWDFEKEKESRTSQEIIQPKTPTDKGYNLYPNPVISELKLDYDLKEDAVVLIQIYTIDGRLMKLIDKKQQSMGSYSEPIDCSGLAGGSYIIKIKIGERVVSEKFIKK